MSQKILICPMDWGLGHATRDVTIINTLLQKDFEVILGADGAPLSFLQQHFPQLEYIKIPSVKIKYPLKSSMALYMLFYSPKILWGIFKEHRLLQKIVKTHEINIVLSDNRFGLWSRAAHNIFITHQLRIQAPRRLKWLEPLINKINHWFIKKYDNCWIPDVEGKNSLAGKLVSISKHGIPINYIGYLSRFNNTQEDSKDDVFNKTKFDILVVLSGLEPQRSILEEIINKQVQNSEYKVAILQGKPGELTITKVENRTIYNHLDTNSLNQLLLQTPIIICRSGYSSIMDLVCLGKTAILIPTPGQTEQEYLAEYMQNKNWFYTVKQNDFDLKKAIDGLKKTKINCKFEENDLLEKEIDKLISVCT